MKIIIVKRKVDLTEKKDDCKVNGKSEKCI